MTEFLNKAWAAVQGGYKIISMVFLCFILAVAGYFIKQRLFPGKKIQAPPVIGTAPDFKPVNWEDEEATLEYVQAWLNMYAPHVLSKCFPAHKSVKECEAK